MRTQLPLLALKMEEGAMWPGCLLSRCWKRRWMLPQSLHEGSQPCRYLALSPGNFRWTFNLQNQKIMNLGCLKPLKVCGNLLAARENPRAIKHNAVAVTPLYCPLPFPLLSCISQINTFYWSLFAISNPMFLNVRKKGFYSEIPFPFASLFLPCLELCISR